MSILKIGQAKMPSKNVKRKRLLSFTLHVAAEALSSLIVNSDQRLDSPRGWFSNWMRKILVNFK